MRLSAARTEFYEKVEMAFKFCNRILQLKGRRVPCGMTTNTHMLKTFIGHLRSSELTTHNAPLIELPTAGRHVKKRVGMGLLV